MLSASLLLTSISLFLLKRKLHSRTLSAGMAIIVFVLLVLSGFWWISNYFSGEGINELVIFHLMTDLSGAGLSEFKYHFIFSGAYFFAILFASIQSYRFVQAKTSIAQNKLPSLLALALLTSSVIIHPALADISRILEQKIAMANNQASDTGQAFEIDEREISNKKNIVYIYLESVEATYLDAERFPNLMPNISQYVKNSVSFSDIRQIYGDGWTIGGMVSSQCGVPLVTASGGNSMAGVDRFLPGAVCLGDILENNGYRLEYYGGASLDFAGKGNFYRTHGFNRVVGFSELKVRVPVGSSKSSWGWHDDDLFDVVGKRVEQLIRDDEPFGLVTLTLDTHHPAGHESPSCANIKYKDGSNPILNAVHCTDKLLFDLVERIKELDTRNNTLVVVSSDHLAMPNTVSHLLKNGDRKNLLFILNSDLPDQVIDKTGALFDVAPTILDLLGSNQTNLGFGKSLLREDATLIQQPSDAWTLVAANSAFFSALWNYPSIRNGLSVHVDEQLIDLQQRQLRYPALLVLDDDLNTEAIYFQHHSEKTVGTYFSDLSTSTGFLWIDSCDQTAVLGDNHWKTNGDCVSYGKVDHSDVVVRTVSDGQHISFDDIASIINARSVSPDPPPSS